MNDQQELTPQEAPMATATMRRRATIGLPKCENPAEKRFPLTPEAVARLTAQGFGVVMESGGAASIHYPDSAYVKACLLYTSPSPRD